MTEDATEEPEGLDCAASLHGSRIVVTGAASGIGLAAARFFVGIGAEVVVTDHDASQLAAVWAGYPSQRVSAADVSTEAGCETIVAAALGALGGIDGLFNSAGISDPVVRAIDLDVADWQRVIDVNLRGTFLICRAAGRVMLAEGAGAIVTMSSVNGLNGIPRRHAYGSAKAAVAQLTRTLACEWGGSGVRVNALAPAYIRTPMIDRLASEGKVDVDRLSRRTPLGRLGETGEVARAAAFLLSDWSRYITGAVLPVDGGWLAYGGPGDVDSA